MHVQPISGSKILNTTTIRFFLALTPGLEYVYQLTKGASHETSLFINFHAHGEESLKGRNSRKT
jgi:hypothetical protein